MYGVERGGSTHAFWTLRPNYGTPLGAVSSPARFELDPERMLVFAAIARTGGVRGAASVLGIPRSTVSRRLADLERQAGGSLVLRTSRRFALTELGAALVGPCAELEDLLGRADDLVRRASREPSGVLRVSAAPVLGEEILPDLLSRLLSRHPRLSVDARLTVDYADLRRGGVDVALRAWPIEDSSDVFAVRLGTSTTGCWVSPAYARERGVPGTPAELRAHNCILVGSASPVIWLFRAGRGEQRVTVNGRARVDSFRVACALAVRGAGIVRTARTLADRLVASGELVPVLEPYWIKTPLHAVHAGPNPPSPKVRAFIDLARDAMAGADGLAL
jgi:DNA-binding transcriptional LysR family regulator